MQKFILIFSILLTINLHAEDIVPKGKFLTDSVKIGEPVKFSLSAYHLRETQILFPDSVYNFSPFEIIKKEYFPTVTKNNQSFDSAVYELRTFDLNSTLVLSLPVFIIDEGDSTAYYSSNDTIFLKQYLPEIPLTMDMKEHVDFYSVKQEFDYPHVITYTGAILFLIFILYFVFGKAVSRRYKLIKVRSDYMSFMKNFKKLQNEFIESKGSFAIEQALSSWKAYLARLENKPINTYTTTEIINLYDKEELKNSLNVIDKAIYGGLISDEAEKALNTLKRFSNRQYHQRKKKIQNV